MRGFVDFCVADLEPNAPGVRGWCLGSWMDVDGERWSQTEVATCQSSSLRSVATCTDRGVFRSLQGTGHSAGADLRMLQATRRSLTHWGMGQMSKSAASGCQDEGHKEAEARSNTNRCCQGIPSFITIDVALYIFGACVLYHARRHCSLRSNFPTVRPKTSLEIDNAILGCSANSTICQAHGFDPLEATHPVVTTFWGGFEYLIKPFGWVSVDVRDIYSGLRVDGTIPKFGGLYGPLYQRHRLGCQCHRTSQSTVVTVSLFDIDIHMSLARRQGTLQGTGGRFTELVWFERSMYTMPGPTST